MDLAFDSTALIANLLVPVQILFVNLLLSADNALVIAMACRGLRAADIRRATLAGIVGAIALRLAMGSVAIFLLRAPFLQLLAGVALLWIAVRLTLIGDPDETISTELDGKPATGFGDRIFLDAVWAIVVADVAMSLDNVVAIAAIAQGSLVYIAAGLALSIPMLIWGSNLIRELLDRSGLLVLVSGAFLGWVAGGVAVTDPMISPTIAADAPALPYAVPAACAIFVVWQNFIFDPRRRGARLRYAD